MEKERAIILHRNWQRFRSQEHAGISALPVGEKFSHYHALIKGPKRSPFAGGYFQVCILFEKQYPYKPNQTKVWFLTPIYHPAVYFKNSDKLNEFKANEICYPSVLSAPNLSLTTILKNIRNDFLRKPNTFLHKPANENALDDMFQPSRNRRDELKLGQKMELSLLNREMNIEYLPELATLVGDTDTVSTRTFKRLVKNESLTQIVSWLSQEEEKIKDYAQTIGAPYPEPISTSFDQVLQVCMKDNTKKVREIFVNRFLMKFFHLLFYQSKWWNKAAEGTRKFASLEQNNQTFNRWSCAYK